MVNGPADKVFHLPGHNVPLSIVAQPRHQE